MYRPRSFRVEDLAEMDNLIRSNSFGIVFSTSAYGPEATHLPWMLDPARGPFGTLIAHMARANRLWKSWVELETELLVVFQGPHTYISPAWYEDQVTVPTWNYAAVHAYGRPVLITDHNRLRTMVESLIQVHETPLGCPWDAAKKEAIMDIELKGIVGFDDSY